MSTDYSKLSDFEINKCVAKIHGGFALTLAVHNEPPSGKSFDPGRFDPCNNPADAWPIIVENSISIINDKDCFPRATNDSFLFINDQFDDCIHWCDRNPLKAAMIVFLMMQESKNAS